MAGFRPLIRGFFFYTQKKHCFPHFTTGGFRPLIRGFFFYFPCTKRLPSDAIHTFLSVPIGIGAD